MDTSRKGFTIKPCDPLSCKIVGMFLKILNDLSQQNLELLKKFINSISKAKREENATVVEKYQKILFPHFNLRIPHLKKTHIKSIRYMQ
ncbi:hypothetical protein HNQ69_000056 [Bartonella callosciuri]|uniref:Uncharacterized protein n=1 Tax=Bartonella callosciuri TaxID=686223 RepID=A0A840NUN6_9HYPH|nr:hypothetical protein [Bartonella callosciuri]